MAPILESFSLLSCAHRFAWPRRNDSGSYYQVCVDCGAEYRYDWNSMRRIEQLRRGTEARVHRSELHARERRSWRPRERRLKLNLPLRFRLGDSLWHEAVVENISRSGVLFRCESEPKLPALDANVELVFEMPQEISGADASRVLCYARVARVTAEDGVARIAARIEDYDFLTPAVVS